MLVFELLRREALVADDDAMRNADQFSVGEHRTGTVAAIVERNVDAGSGQFVVQFFSRLLHRRRLVAADRTDDDAKRCDRVRPDDAVGIKGLFNHRRRQTRHADAVATRSEEHTSELQSLMRISYAVFCLKKKQTNLDIKSITETQ